MSMVELMATVDGDRIIGLTNWTTSRKYVINRPRICNVKHLQCEARQLFVTKL